MARTTTLPFIDAPLESMKDWSKLNLVGGIWRSKVHIERHQPVAGRLPEKELCHSSMALGRVVPFYFHLKCCAALIDRCTHHHWGGAALQNSLMLCLHCIAPWAPWRLRCNRQVCLPWAATEADETINQVCWSLEASFYCNWSTPTFNSQFSTLFWSTSIYGLAEEATTEPLNTSPDRHPSGSARDWRTKR